MLEPTKPSKRIKGLTATPRFRRPDLCSVAVCSVIAKYEKELKAHMKIEADMGQSLIRDAKLIRQKDELLRQKDILSKEAEHRLLNGLQLVKSVLAMQSRRAENQEAASVLKEAAHRVSLLARVHQRLHAIDAVEEIDFKEYLVQLCDDLSEMTSTEIGYRSVSVNGAKMKLPRATATPLSFIASELVTNSMKHADGKIEVELQLLPNGMGVLSVSDDGPGLPEGFDPEATKGLGMKIITAFAKQIHGELRYGGCVDGVGTRFSLTFAVRPQHA